MVVCSFTFYQFMFSERPTPTPPTTAISTFLLTSLRLIWTNFLNRVTIAGFNFHMYRAIPFQLDGQLPSYYGSTHATFINPSLTSQHLTTYLTPPLPSPTPLPPLTPHLPSPHTTPPLTPHLPSPILPSHHTSPHTTPPLPFPSLTPHLPPSSPLPSSPLPSPPLPSSTLPSPHTTPHLPPLTPHLPSPLLPSCRDPAICLAWLILLLLGVVVQSLLSCRRPPSPPSPSTASGPRRGRGDQSRASIVLQARPERPVLCWDQAGREDGADYIEPKCHNQPDCHFAQTLPSHVFGRTESEQNSCLNMQD